MKKEIMCAFIMLCLISFWGAAFANQQGDSHRKQIHKKRFYKNLIKFKKFGYKDRFHSELTDKEKLGKKIFQDQELSLFRNQACNSCHHKSVKFVDPDNVVAPTFRPVSMGSDETLFGGRNAPTSSYAGFSPRLHWDTADELFIGGLFWDGRASGQVTTATANGGVGDPVLETQPTLDPLADQAKGPFLNPVEMGLVYLEDVTNHVRNFAPYRNLFQKVYGDSIDIPTDYNNVADALAAYQRSFEVNKFSSKFDDFVREQGGDVSQFGIEIDSAGFRKYVGPPPGFKSKFLTYDQADGLALFNADSDVQA